MPAITEDNGFFGVERSSTFYLNQVVHGNNWLKSMLLSFNSTDLNLSYSLLPIKREMNSHYTLLLTSFTKHPEPCWVQLKSFKS